MKWSEGTIARALSTQFFNRKYLCVVPNCNWTGHECDLLVVTENLRIIDVEIKISRADLKADAKKEKWWHREFKGYWPSVSELQFHDRLQKLVEMRRWQHARYETKPREWPPKVWKHYYAMPKAIWTPDLLDALPNANSGVLLLEERKSGTAGYVDITCVRRATPSRDAKPINPQAAIDIARLASLRMWDAVSRADATQSRLTEAA